MTFDLCMTQSGKGPNSVAQRLLVLTDEAAANELADAINARASHLFQCDGLAATVVPSHRDGSAPAPEPAPAAPSRRRKRSTAAPPETTETED